MSQDMQKNLTVCDGCDAQCQLGAVEINLCWYPTVEATLITHIPDGKGNMVKITHTDFLTKESAVAQARQSAMRCQHYKTK